MQQRKGMPAGSALGQLALPAGWPSAGPGSEPWVLTGVDAGYLRPPGDQLGAGVVVGNLALDEDRPALVGAGFFDRAGQFAGGGRRQSHPGAVFGVERVDESGVVPVLVVVIGTVVDRRLDH